MDALLLRYDSAESAIVSITDTGAVVVAALAPPGLSREHILAARQATPFAPIDCKFEPGPYDGAVFRNSHLTIPLSQPEQEHRCKRRIVYKDVPPLRRN